MAEDVQIYTIESGDFKMEAIPNPLLLSGNSAILFELSGEINLYNSQAIRENLDKLIGLGIRNFYLDLELVAYIDSSGLGVFLGIHSKLSKMNGFLRLISPSEKVRYVLELTKLKSLLQIFPTLKDALPSN